MNRLKMNNPNGVLNAWLINIYRKMYKISYTKQKISLISRKFNRYNHHKFISTASQLVHQMEI